MDLGLDKKKALVTGSGRGIGMGIVKCLATEGAQVGIVARTAADVKKVLKEIGGEGMGHAGVNMDLAPDTAPAELIATMKNKGFWPIDIIVHNLGGTLDIKDPFCSIEDWKRTYRLNFEVALELNLVLVPQMQERHWGRVVHISSIAAMENQGPVTYCAMKAMLTAYTRSFGGVVAPDGVVVSAVLPGAVYTDGGYWDVTSKSNPDHVHKFLTERQRIGRFGKIEEIANYVTFLCSELASFNTGSVVPVDGGQGRGYFGQ